MTKYLTRILDRIVKISKSYFFVNTTIIGISGSGKTNIAFWLTEKLLESKAYRDYVYIKLESADELENIEFNVKNAIYIFEDFTYLAARHTALIDKFLRKLMLARHTAGRLHVITILHYTTAALPVLRNSRIRVLTSLLNQYEITQLKKYFDLQALWDYYVTYTRSIGEFWALINAQGTHAIVKPPLSRLYKK